jgi:hypothetical protein
LNVYVIMSHRSDVIREDRLYIYILDEVYAYRRRLIIMALRYVLYVKNAKGASLSICMNIRGVVYQV